MTQDVLANSVVEHMIKNDAFSEWLGVNVLEIREGYSCISLTIRKEMIKIGRAHV